MTPQQQAKRTMGTSSEGYLARTINWKPVIAAVHGYALGAGTSIAAECDLIVASEEAQFGITETKRGLPGARVWAKLNAFMPSKIVTEMVITGEPVELQTLPAGINKQVSPHWTALGGGGRSGKQNFESATFGYAGWGSVDAAAMGPILV
ncbi:MAG: hypothetical protein CM1200mP35_06520 [Chloroflexota bacterium]|nr:MAG: hypothetical protein CM1200mP35_06520 [Chloroflexota bacterium]